MDDELRLQLRWMANTMDDIKAKLYALKHPDENFMDNDEFLKRMNVSKRTAANWRHKGLIRYYQVGSTIYYSTAQITDFLQKHEVTHANKRRSRVATP